MVSAFFSFPPLRSHESSFIFYWRRCFFPISWQWCRSRTFFFFLIMHFHFPIEMTVSETLSPLICIRCLVLRKLSNPTKNEKGVVVSVLFLGNDIDANFASLVTFIIKDFNPAFYWSQLEILLWWFLRFPLLSFERLVLVYLIGVISFLFLCNNIGLRPSFSF